MENIYKSWQSYHKEQKKWLDSLSHHVDILPAEKWRDQGFPSGEDWKYVDFSSLSKQDFKPRTHSEQPFHGHVDDDFFHLTLRDFSRPMDWVATGLPKGLRVLNFRQVLADPDLREDYLARFAQRSATTSSLAQSALSFLGLGLYIEFDKSLETAVKITLDLENSVAPEFANFHCWLKSRTGSYAKVFLDVKGSSFQGYCQTRLDIDSEEKSQLQVCHMQVGGEKSYFYQSLHAQVQKEASLNLWDVTLPGAWSRHDSHIHLNEAHAETNLRGLYLGQENDFTDHHTWTHHHVGHTQSSQDYRGLLADRSRAVFNGKVFIDKKAVKSNSEQMNKNILLSGQAEVDTKPELQIDNDDVKAAHGATVGQLDSEQMFYLLSRGYGRELAKTSLCRAFIYDQLDQESELTITFYQQSLNEQLGRLRES